MGSKKEDLEMAEISGHEHGPVKTNQSGGFTGLSKAELLDIEQREGVWKKLRIGLLIAFWVIWIALLVGSVLVIYTSPACPSKKKLEPFQKSCVYRLNPFAFYDADGDKTGDIKGLRKKWNYITKDIKAQTIILDPITKGENDKEVIHTVTDFKQLDSSLGSLEELKEFIKVVRKSGNKVIMSLDLNSMSASNSLAVKANLRTKPGLSAGRNGNANICTLNNEKYATSIGAASNGSCVSVDLDLNKKTVVDIVKGILSYWMKDVGFDGVLLTNANEFLYKTEERNTLLKDLQKYVSELGVASNKKYFMIEVSDKTSDAALTDMVSQKVADLVIASDLLVNNKFWSMKDFTLSNDTALNIGLTTANQFNALNFNLQRLLASYTFKTVSVVYMGSELGTSNSGKSAPSGTLDGYPYDAKRFANILNDKKVILNFARIQWSDATLNETYRKQMGVDSNVELLSAYGAPRNVFTLSKQLAKLKTTPSMLYGDMTWLKNTDKNVLVYKRSAQGHPAYVIAYLKSAKDGISLSIASEKCATGKIVVAYPSGGKLDVGTSGVKLSNVYLKVKTAKSDEAVYVIECE